MGFDYIGLANFIVLFFTAIVVFLYTRAAQRNNEIQEQPFIHLEFRDTTRVGSSPDGFIYIKNLGKGPAYDISIKPFKVVEGNMAFTYKFYLDDPILRPRACKKLKIWIATQDGGVEGSDMMRFIFRVNNLHVIHPDFIKYMRENPTIFLVHYRGFNDRRYYSIFRFYSDLPGAGGMIMQFVKHGRGFCSMRKAQSFSQRVDIIKTPGEEIQETRELI